MNFYVYRPSADPDDDYPCAGARWNEQADEDSGSLFDRWLIEIRALEDLLRLQKMTKQPITLTTHGDAQLILIGTTVALGLRDQALQGGQATYRKYGSAFFQENGKKGGIALRDKYGTEHFRQLGRRGAAIRHGKKSDG